MEIGGVYDVDRAFGFLEVIIEVLLDIDHLFECW